MSALILERCVFLHVPKTGGTWAIDALGRQGLVRARITAPDGSTHPTLATLRQVTDLPVIAAVRDPVAWLRSFWRFFLARNWRDAVPPHPGFEPLLVMATPSFPEFAARYLKRRPGYVSELLAQYADGADWVCRQEELLGDLGRGLRRFDQPHLPDVMASTPPANRSRRFDAACAPEIESEIRRADHWILETFYGA